MKSTPEITILPFQPDNQDEVKQLILDGMLQHWGVLDLRLNPDLNDIGSSYAGALFPRSADTAEIVRMSVAADMRRLGIGSLILQSLCAQAEASGYRHSVLETTETWQEVITFYQQFGFQISHHHAGEVYFALDLSERRIAK